MNRFREEPREIERPDHDEHSLEDYEAIRCAGKNKPVCDPWPIQNMILKAMTEKPRDPDTI